MTRTFTYSDDGKSAWCDDCGGRYEVVPISPPPGADLDAFPIAAEVHDENCPESGPCNCEPVDTLFVPVPKDR